jgi:hypothetical protein
VQALSGGQQQRQQGPGRTQVAQLVEALAHPQRRRRSPGLQTRCPPVSTASCFRTDAHR